ncbi:RNA polymerase-associated protein RapA [Thiorhodovibrio winogradskyi]|uniref:RNA polymerase-associated protein RapA n=1 Tax=Thiorhodovibrio winogradskyi TaxID=77007 RepID=A0ABZ0SCJ9_9GAMM|nr:helicase-related protein [Thiorhodovibrio winogradskyi]
MTSLRLRDYPWRPSYATSDLPATGQPVDMLRDFYLPALTRAIRYDRVAGYFTSSSLAAASQGFSHFVGQGGQARFVVGLQLDPEDAQAILDGDQARAEARLLAQLDDAPRWPVAVRNGVELLGWMVARGVLSIRVGLRVHGGDGHPRPLDYAGDGYLHEKWAIFRDATDALFVSGSLNESRTALAVNAENITVQPSWNDWNRDLFAEKEHSFARLWDGTHPHIRTLSLPEAVAARLIEIAQGNRRPSEIDGTAAHADLICRHDWAADPNGQPVKPSFNEQLAFALIRLAPLLPGGERAAMDTLPIEPWPHQRFVARRLLATWPRNHLLCDEVGLGKTIEAGLAFRALWLSGRARSIRVFAPASLTAQWLREMAEKFLLPFVRRTNRAGDWERIDLRTGEVIAGKGRLFDAPLEIISTGLLINRQGGRILAEMPETDLVLVDEAHKARRDAPDQRARLPRFNRLYQELEERLYPKAKALWLATATPMQINRVEAFDLLRLMPAAGAVQYSEDLCDLFYRLPDRLLAGDSLQPHEEQWLQRYLREARESAPEQWHFALEQVLGLFGQMGLNDFVDRGQSPLGGWGELQPALSLLAPLGRAMLRHNRSLLRAYQQQGLLNANLAKREVQPCIIAMTADEREVYDQLQGYCAELAQRIGENMDEGRQRAAIGFYLSFLRLRLASSFQALRCSMERRLVKIAQTLAHKAGSLGVDESNRELLEELDETQIEALVLKHRTESDLTWEQTAVEDLLAAIARLSGLPSKTRHLLRQLDGRRLPDSDRLRQVVIFTRYTDTLDALHAELCGRLPGCPIGTFTGEGGCLRAAGTARTKPLDRTAIKQQFVAGEIDLLLCTDAAAEGLNLQSADWLINFDLPWKPMMLEQRIGRIDRIGQHHTRIFVFNYLYQDSVEEVVYARLVRRFRDAISVAGELQFSLLPIQSEDFEDFAKSAQEPGGIDEAGLLARAEAHAREIGERQRLTELPAEALKAAYDALDSAAALEPQSARLETVWQVLRQSAQPGGYLHALGVRVETFPPGEALALPVLGGMEGPVRLTPSRQLFELGIGLDDGRRLHFATHGDPVFEQLLDLVLRPDPTLFDRIHRAWEAREPLAAVQLGEQRLTRLDDGLVAASLSAGPLALQPRTVPANAPASDRIGRAQVRVLERAAAYLAQSKLKAEPATVAQQMAEFQRFQQDVSRRVPPLVRFGFGVPDRQDILALAERLLWPLAEDPAGVRIEGDPLLLAAIADLLQRQLSEMKPNQRTGQAVARGLRAGAARL